MIPQVIDISFFSQSLQKMKSTIQKKIVLQALQNDVTIKVNIAFPKHSVHIKANQRVVLIVAAFFHNATKSCPVGVIQ